MLTYRDRVNGLVLSELGGYLESPDKAPAGTKRLSNLLHSVKCFCWLSSRFLWQRATRQRERWPQAGQQALAIWDESDYEKPETIASPDLCPLRSSKAARLTHIKAGYFSPPRGPRASFKRDEEGKLLVELATAWGREVTHVFARG
jgi:hypothetical protein